MPTIKADPFKKEYFTYPPSIFIKGNINKQKFYYIEKLLNKYIVYKGGKIVV